MCLLNNGITLIIEDVSLFPRFHHQSITSVNPIQHNHRIRVDIHDTQVILEQLMVDAVIRVFAEIRFSFPIPIYL